MIIGAAAAIISGGYSVDATGTVAEDIASIVGGTLAGALRTSALYQESEQQFEHEDNVLREVWENPLVPRYIAPSVWEFLNRPMKEAPPGSRSVREELVKGWRQEGRLDTDGTPEQRHRIELLFADHGLSRSSDLTVRGQMLDMLGATITLMNQDLDVLIREVMIQMALRKQARQSVGSPP